MLVFSKNDVKHTTILTLFGCFNILTSSP